MECKFSKLERILVDYIINLIGPNTENELDRSEKLNTMKKIINNSFCLEKNIIPHIFCFGSFPLKTYLPDSDMDITIILEDKQTNTIITNFSFEFLNKILLLIQNALELHNRETGVTQITEISLIMADVKLVKCKYETLSFDISINNFVGLCKLMLINNFEKLLENSDLFKRSLFIIKAWCYFEGSLLGSNLGLLASYALEIIVMYIFNKNNHKIKTEIDTFCLFFEEMNDFKWEKDILCILGKINIDLFQEEFKSNSYSLENLQSLLNENNEIIKYSELKELVNFFDKFSDLDKIQNFNSNKKIFPVKFINIIDPMFYNNNLGKSVNLHNYNRFVKVIEYGVKDIKNLRKLKENNNSPDRYLNQLLKIFEKTITYNTPDLFYYNLPQPKIFISLHKSKEIDTKENFSNNPKNKEIKNLIINFNQLILRNVKDYDQIDKQIQDSGNLNEIKNIENENLRIINKSDECKINQELNSDVEDSYFNYVNSNVECLNNFMWPNKNEITNKEEIISIIENFSETNIKNFITKDIVDFFTTNLDNPLLFKFSTVNEINLIEDFLKKCKFEA